MKKILLTAVLILTTLLTTNAQNLVFDNAFNNGNPALDGYNATVPPNYDYSDYGRMKQLNDSIFVYYINSVDWTTNLMLSEAIAVISHSDGSVENYVFYNSSYNFSQVGNPDYFFITDIIINPTNGQTFVVRNDVWNDAGTNRRCVIIIGHQFESNGPSFPTIPNWGISGTGIAQISAPNVNMWNAKGSLIGSYPCVAFNYAGGVSTPIAFSTLGNMGAYVGFSVIPGTVNNMHSQIADVVAVSSYEVYIADNAYTYNGSNPTTYNDNTRVLKWMPASITLDPNYGGGDGIADISWSNQSNTPFVQDQIKRIRFIDNGGTDYGKLLVTGTSREDIDAQYTPVHGKVTRINNNGTMDNTFGVNGTFAPNFSADRFRTHFNDIDIEMDVLGGTEGSYYISGSGSVNDSPHDPNECFLLAIDINGQIETGKGNNGFLFENANYSEIVETIIVPGNTALEDEFVFNGMKIINPDPQMYEQETAVGRLVWNNGVSGVNEVTTQNILSLYPNPANTTLYLELKETTQIQILNVLGEIMVSQHAKEGNNTISVSELPSGIYFVHTENGAATKFIKQ